MATIIGIDNGPSGTIGAVDSNGLVYWDDTPTIRERNYTKKEGYHQRLDRVALKAIIRNCEPIGRAFIERPFSGRFAFTAKYALAFHEATIITLEDMGVPYTVVDSKDWQIPLMGKMPPKTTKAASVSHGIKLYPKLSQQIRKHGDADGLLIAHYYYHKTIGSV